MNDSDNRSAAQLFNDPAFSDVKIKHVYNGKVREYFAHRAVLCLESRYFLKMFKGSFKVRKYKRKLERYLTLIQEAGTQVIELHDDDPDHFEFLLKYIYTYQYDTDTIIKLAMDDPERRVTIPISVYAVADKYDVPRIYDPITADVRSQLNIDAFELLEAAISTHYASVASVGGPLGKLFASILLEGQRKFTDTPAYRELVFSNPVFGADMALALAHDMVNSKCPSCMVSSVVRSDVYLKKPNATVRCQTCTYQVSVRQKTLHCP
ncbi:uncharacterized protein EKO05_0007858 [Ascochyta rabiei]|uniref:Uncharacterized protein n=1 Tax=Didymella rabiei TaxID=5454 RepID=A0A163BXF9_DIDRA|nr:uncharacterized protein EKO05_0007858 [Ascochyta rabiei]KZM22069.1 hypothetical protein ST47_g6802 [Ascochyta rabiei]UPX17509.1 hypothetical protein EKO05_0007858 [Ascochyta rabiei]